MSYVISLDSIDCVPAGESESIDVAATKSITLKMLLVAPSIATSFEIRRVVIGGTDQLTENAYPLSCELFASNQPNPVELMLDDVLEGETITVDVHNLSMGNLRFNGMFIGDVEEE